MLFEDFAKKKFTDYASLVQTDGGKVYLKQVRESSLPPFIINFFERTHKNLHSALTEQEFMDTLNHAVIFNINYIIKPKNTLLKFLFGEYETRPADYIRDRLGYFLFYNYYISHIENFIILNSPVTVSVNQVEHLINVVNKQILDEISNPSNGDAQRLNLVKLLYIFFIDLVKNNPINIKLPKKLLSAFFGDKGYTQICNRIDRFFSEEIFIQETIELMKPKQKKARIKESEADIDIKAKEILSKAKTILISEEASDKDITKALPADESVPDSSEFMREEHKIEEKTFRKAELKEQEPKQDKPDLGDEIFSKDFILQSQLGNEESSKPLREKEHNEEIFDKLFCEETYRKKILKKIFRRDENFFKEFVYSLLNEKNWENAARKIDEMFSNKRINYLSDEAVKFVDVMQNHFSGNLTPDDNLSGNN